MNRAEKLSQNRYPTLAEELAFIDGYEEAEQDLEFSWKDIEKICQIAKESHKFHGCWCEIVYDDILKRFKERNKK